MICVGYTVDVNANTQFNTTAFIEYNNHKEFGRAVVNHYDNNKLRGPSQKLYRKIFNGASLYVDDGKLKNYKDEPMY